MSRTWEIRLPWTKPPLSLNDRSHWAVKANRTGLVRAKTAEALTHIVARLIRHQQTTARGDTGPTEFTRLADADAAVWRCVCGSWRLGSRDCGVCPRIVEVAA